MCLSALINVGPGRGVGAAPGFPAVETRQATGTGQRVDSETHLLSAPGRPRAWTHALRIALRLWHFHSLGSGASSFIFFFLQETLFARLHVTANASLLDFPFWRIFLM